MKLIAEIKKASPHDGVLCPNIMLEYRVKDYERLGASAISIVTAQDFQGEKQWITEARKHTKLPILRKDFIVSVDELKETADLGADWVLLIAEMLTAKELDNLTFHASRLGLRPIVEVQSIYGTSLLDHCDTNDVLINNRNLRTGRINMMTAFDLLPMISDKYVITVASGFDTKPILLKVLRKSEEFDYFLVGKMLMQSTNLEETFKEHNLCLK